MIVVVEVVEGAKNDTVGGNVVFLIVAASAAVVDNVVFVVWVDDTTRRESLGVHEAVGDPSSGLRGQRERLSWAVRATGRHGRAAQTLFKTKNVRCI